MYYGIFGSSSEIVIYTNVKCDTATFEYVVLHELVHYAGVRSHLGECPSLMCRTPTWRNSCLDERSWKLVRATIGAIGGWCDENGYFVDIN
jgi:hypothetical protein